MGGGPHKGSPCHRAPSAGQATRSPCPAGQPDKAAHGLGLQERGVHTRQQGGAVPGPRATGKLRAPPPLVPYVRTPGRWPWPCCANRKEPRGGQGCSPRVRARPEGRAGTGTRSPDPPSPSALPERAGLHLGVSGLHLGVSETGRTLPAPLWATVCPACRPLSCFREATARKTPLAMATRWGN